MVNLDNLDTIKRYDRLDMLGILTSFPDQCRAAKAIGMRFRVPESFIRSYRSIVCTGLGGSAIGADIIRSYMADGARVPILVNRNYILPGFVGKDCLVIASSYSGGTEETLSAYNDARSRKAGIIVLTSGGELQKMAERDGNPVVILPRGLPPRCALGYSSLSLLILLSKMGIIGDQRVAIDEMIRVLEYLNDRKIGPTLPCRSNIAKSLAGRLFLKFPVVYSSQDHLDSVVTRWRGELSENSKTLSSGHLFPEMNHNEIVGWANPRKILKEFIAVLLRDQGDHPRIARRMDITKKILEKNGFNVIEVHSYGKGLLARIFSLVYTGDFVSFYLAILNKCDPTPVDRITYLKEELRKA